MNKRSVVVVSMVVISVVIETMSIIIIRINKIRYATAPRLMGVVVCVWSTNLTRTVSAVLC